MAGPTFPIDVPPEQRQVEGDQQTSPPPTFGLAETHRRNPSLFGVDKPQNESVRPHGPIRYREE